MNNTLKYIIVASLMLTTSAFNAQAKNQKTIKVKIYGNCGMCESTIEKAGNLKNQANVDWDKESKMAIISFDSLKTSAEEILKRVALAGYDSDTFLAPDDTYSSLPSCCQYERAKKVSSSLEEPKMEMASTEHLNHSTMSETMQQENPLSVVFDNYFAVKDALVKTDGNMASVKAKELLSAISEVQMGKLSMDVHMVWMKVLENLKKDAKNIANTNEASQQRNYFNSLSKNLYELMKVSKQATPTYYQFCPMANEGKGANWLSKEETIKNPYYGSQMLSCGSTVEIIKE